MYIYMYCIALHCIKLHCISLQYMTSNFKIIHYIRLHTTYVCVLVYIYIYIHIYTYKSVGISKSYHNLIISIIASNGPCSERGGALWVDVPSSAIGWLPKHLLVTFRPNGTPSKVETVIKRYMVYPSNVYSLKNIHRVCLKIGDL